MTIAFVDVDYPGTGARAACVLIESWEAESPTSTYVQDIEAVEPYEPGSFYRREMPCILSVLRMLPSLPQTVHAGRRGAGVFKPLPRPSWDIDADTKSDIAA